MVGGNLLDSKLAALEALEVDEAHILGTSKQEPVSLADDVLRHLGLLDHDVERIPGMRVVQLTPPGSSASIVIGTGMTNMLPGTVEGLQLVVPGMDAARNELLRRGAPISETQEMCGFAFAYFSAIRTATAG
jgi:hypothetical protein